MKRRIALLLAVLLLSGCSPKPNDTTPEETTAPTEATQEPSFVQYEPGHPVEVLTHGGVKRYALEGEGYQQLLAMGEGILLLSGQAKCNINKQRKIPIGTFIVTHAKGLRYNGTATGAKHKTHRGHDHQEREDQIQRRKRGLSCKI